MPESTTTERASVQQRLEMVDTERLQADLNAFGYALIAGLLRSDESANLARLYQNDRRFRSHVIMARHGFGSGEYKYFSYPLPDTILALRQGLYPILEPVANQWNERMGFDTRFPPEHRDYVKMCHASGQTRPTPLLLQYGENDYNCLHQDVYGDLVFPLQVAVLLSEPVHDFQGGEFVLTEQRPRMQSRAEVVPLRQGDAVVFAVRNRPVRGSRGDYRVSMRHGVSRVRGGQRHTVGIIFHDAS